MNFDTTTLILIIAAVILGVAYFARRSARVKKQKRRL